MRQKPTASSKSLPGVRIVVDTTVPSSWIVIGSSTIRSSGDAAHTVGRHRGDHHPARATPTHMQPSGYGRVRGRSGSFRAHATPGWGRNVARRVRGDDDRDDRRARADRARTRRQPARVRDRVRACDRDLDRRDRRRRQPDVQLRAVVRARRSAAASCCSTGSASSSARCSARSCCSGSTTPTASSPASTDGSRATRCRRVSISTCTSPASPTWASSSVPSCSCARWSSSCCCRRSGSSARTPSRGAFVGGAMTLGVAVPVPDLRSGTQPGAQPGDGDLRRHRPNALGQVWVFVVVPLLGIVRRPARLAGDLGSDDRRHAPRRNVRRHQATEPKTFMSGLSRTVTCRLSLDMNGVLRVRDLRSPCRRRHRGHGAASFSGLSAMTASVVRNRAAIEAAFCSAERVTLAASMTPTLTRSS